MALLTTQLCVKQAKQQQLLQKVYRRIKKKEGKYDHD